MFTRNKLILLSLMPFIAALPTVASADTAADRKIVASKAYVDTKQDIIETGLVTFNEPEENIDYDVPALVSYGTGTNNADGVLGNKIGVLGINQSTGGLYSYDFLDIWDDEESGYLDNFVPTVRAVSSALEDLNGTTNSLWNVVSQLGWTPFSWNNNTFPAAIDAYSTTFDTTSTHVNGNWPRSSQAYLVRADTFANSLALKQNKIPAKTTPQNLYTDGSVLTYTNSAGNVGEKYIIYGQMWDDLVTHNETWTDDYQNMLVNAGDIANALDYKQNTIPTNHITWYEGSDDPEEDDPPEYVPALVVTNAAGTALNGNTIGIVSYEQISYSLSSRTQAFFDNFVPTVRVVAQGLSELNTRISNLNWSTFAWSNNIQTSINRYYTDTYTGHWPSGYETKLINGEVFAKGLQLKQKRLIPALTATSGNAIFYEPQGGETIEIRSSPLNGEYTYSRYITAGGATPLTVKEGADNVILYVNGTKTLSEFRLSNFGDTGAGTTATPNGFITGALVSLELLKDVYSELNTKITNNSLPTGTTGTVATYNGVTNGVQQFTETAIYNTANAYNATNDANKLATAGFVETKQAKIPTTSDGSNSTPNYVYNATTNPTAAGSVVTTTTTAGTVGQLGIATAPVSDGNGGYSNGDWLPTVDAMMNAISSATPTGTPGNVAMYDASTGALGDGVATYSGATAQNPYNATNDAAKIATAAAVETKQNKIAAGTAGQVVTYTGTAGSVGSATVSSAADYTGTTLNNGSDIANITAVETKQDKIVTSDILLLEGNDDDIPNDIYAPSIVTHDSNDETLVGTQFGILSNAAIENSDLDWEPPYLYDFHDRDDLVPTVAAIAPVLDELWGGIDDVYNAKQDILEKQLHTTNLRPTTNLTPAGGETIDIRGDNTNSSVGRRYITGTGSQALTTKSGADTVLSYVNGTKSVSDFQLSNFGASGKFSTDLMNNLAYIRGALVSLDLLRDTYAELDSKISNAVSAIDFDTLTWDTAETAAANAYSTTFSDSGTNTWPESDEDELVDGAALATALSLKQNKVTTGLVLFDDKDGTENDVYVPALVATNAAGTELSGNTIGIVGGNYVLTTPYNNDINSNMLQYVTRAQYDNFVPTLRTLGWAYNSLAGQISNIQTYPWSALEWSNDIQTSINRYYTDTYTGHWPSDYATKLINGEFLAKALALKQKKLIPSLTATSGNSVFYEPQGGETIEIRSSSLYGEYTYPHYITAGGATPLTVKEGADNVILYVNGTKTLSEFRLSNFGDTGAGTTATPNGFITGALVSLELLKDVYSELNTKITANSRPTGTTGTVATYNGVTNGVQQFTETAIYDPTNTYSSSDSGKLATAGFVATKQDKIPAKANGDPTKIVTYPAYGSAAGAIGELSVDTSTLYTTDDSHVPSSKLVSTSLAGKQDAITTDKVLVAGDGTGENDIYVPSIVTTNAAGTTLTGNSVGLLTYEALDSAGFGLEDFDQADNFVPTTAAVMSQINTRQYNIDSTDESFVYDSSTNRYADGSVVVTTNNEGEVAQRGIATAPVSDGNGGYSNGDWLPTVNAMMTAISSATPTISGTSNTIANFDSTGALGSGIATYDGSGTYAPATDAGKIATAAAVETKQDKIIAGTAGNVVTYTGTAGSVGSATVSSAATYSSDTLTNGSDIANITAVESKVSKTQSTGYQVLTTGTNGTVTADYISVPVTTSGTGRPTSNNAPTGTAAIWIE